MDIYSIEPEVKKKKYRSLKKGFRRGNVIRLK
jgi:hypothetical protein